MSDELKVGDIVNTCTCFFKSDMSHPTEVDRDSCCVYCGYFSIKEKIDISFLKRHRKRKGHYDNNKHKVFQDRMQCLIEGKEYYDIIDLMDNDDSSREE